jgi:hypothetical protein
LQRAAEARARSIYPCAFATLQTDRTPVDRCFRCGRIGRQSRLLVLSRECVLDVSRESVQVAKSYAQPNWRYGCCHPTAENASFLNFPYVCPEPVLVNRSFLA